MAQSFTLDTQAFEQFLAAASLLQQFQRQANQTSGSDTFAQHLLELVQSQKAIESGTLDSDSAVENIVRLALRVLGGQGTAVWLFTNDEFAYRSGAGRSAARDERLRLSVLARVAAICEPSRESFPGQREWAKGGGDSGYYPGCVRSLIVGPIYRNQTVVGALAAFSSDFEVFDHRDAANVRLLSGLIGSAMERAAARESTSVALPRQTLLRVIEHIVPALERLVHQEDSSRQNAAGAALDFAPTSASNSQEAAAEFTPDGQETEAGKLHAVAFVKSDEVANEVAAEQIVDPVSLREDELAEAELKAEPETIAEPVTQSSAEDQDFRRALTLQEELAQLSRSIAEIEEEGKVPIAGSDAVSMIAADSRSGEEATVVKADHVDQEIQQVAFVVDSQAEAAASPAEETTEYSPVADIAVPGIGVRSALYDDEYEEKKPSHVWASMRMAIQQSGHFMREKVGGGIRGLQNAVSGAASNGRRMGAGIRQKTRFHFAMPHFPSFKLGDFARRVRLSFSTSASRAVYRVRVPGSHPVTLPKISKGKAQQMAHQSVIWLDNMATKAGRGFRRMANSLPDLPKGSVDSSRYLHGAKATAVQAIGALKVDGLKSFRLRIRVNGMALRRSASAFAILLVMGAFLVMESGLFHSDTTASASAPSEVAVNKPVTPVSQKQPNVNRADGNNTARAAAPVRTGPTSHLTITDPSTGDLVQNLTRFEVATLRRQADSGDEEAAFQLGMAYEVGYNMKQNCAKAAEWVTRAAEAGLPAAQYNLGLRYRDGDGVEVSTANAEKWLNKAAARKYRPARTALAKLLPQER